MTIVYPELFRFCLSIHFYFLPTLKIINRQIVGRSKGKFIIGGHTPCIQSLRGRHNPKLYNGIVFRFNTRPVFQTFIILFEIHILDIIKIDIPRHVQLHLLDKIGRISFGHINMTCKAERLRIKRNKA